MSIRNSNNKNKTTKVYSQEFQALLDRLEEEDNRNSELFEDEEEEDEEEMEIGGKKCRRRKLGANLVKALERKFAEEHRLGQPRKAAIAAELGLEPRQVAVWFQNRRARSKSKKLETEFSRLQADYASLHQHYDKLRRETDSLVAEVKELEAKVEAKNEMKESYVHVGSSSSSVMVSPATLIDEVSPTPWWPRDEAYVASEQGGYLVNGGLEESAWDVFSSFDQAHFW